MTELEERLGLPDGATLREDMQIQLTEIGNRLRMQLSSSVPRGEFADWQAAVDAIAAAQEVLQAWIKGE